MVDALAGRPARSTASASTLLRPTHPPHTHSPTNNTVNLTPPLCQTHNLVLLLG